MLAEVVRGVDPVRASIGLDDVTGAVVRGVPLTVESESGASTVNPAGNIKAERIGKWVTGSRIQREPVSGAIGLGVRRTVRQPVRSHVAHAAQSDKDDLLYARSVPIGSFWHLPVSAETRFLALNGDTARTSRAAVAGITGVIQHFLQSLHTER